MRVGTRSLSRCSGAIALALSAGALFASGAAAGVLQVTTSASARSSVPDLHVVADTTGPLSTSSSDQSGSPPGQDSSRATASASADYGHLSASTSDAVYGDAAANHALDATATATASWQDVFTIVPRDVATIGSAGHGVAFIDLTGTESIFAGSIQSGLAATQVSYYVRVSLADTDVTYTGTWRQASAQAATFFGDGLPLHAQVPFDAVLGSPIAISVELGLFADTNAQAGVGGSETADGDFSHSLRWGGLSPIVDDLGNPIDFTLTSDSGFDYTKPLPEPGSAALSLEVGLALALAAARLTRRARD
jgi:hypothetical protein